MTTQLATLWTVLGLVAIAAAVYLLHRLRVRQRTVVVETTMFWRQALEETRARVFVQRFRHPFVFLFLLLISSLLWLAFAGLDSSRSSDAESLVLVDGSATMARGDRFARTVERTLDFVDDLPAATRTVILCAGRPQTLLRPGEHVRLLRARFDGIEPAAAPTNFERVLRAHLAVERSTALRVFIVGDSSLDPAFVEGLPSDVSLQRLASAREADAVNRGITALGVTSAASGAWDKVDLLVEVAKTKGADAQSPKVKIADRDLTQTPIRRGDTNAAQFVYRDLACRGELVTVALAGSRDALGIDDTARLVLPNRRQLRIAVQAGLPAIVTSVVEADPALLLVGEDADVVLRRGGSSFMRDTPAMEFVDSAVQEHAFFIQCREDEEPNDVVLRLHDRLGLAEIDAADVARKTGLVISVAAANGDARGLKIWSSLLSEDFNFVRSRSFPLFVAIGVRWIGDVWEPPASLAAGVPVDLAGAELTDDRGRSATTLGDAFTPAAAGLYTSDRDQRLAVSLLDRQTTAPLGAGAALAEADAGSAAFDFISILLVLAFVLLLVEWVLFQRGQIP